MRAIRTPVLLLFIFAAVAAVSSAQSGSDDREVVQAIEILEKIELKEDVNYSDIRIVGNLSIVDLNLEKYPAYRESYEREYGGLSENLSIIGSNIKINNSSIIGDTDFSNALFEKPVSIVYSKMSGGVNFRGSRFCQYAGFSKTRFNQSADFWWAQFNGDADFWGTQFDEGSDFEFAQFSSGALFNSSRSRKDAIFDFSSFNDSANFDYCDISGELSLDGAYIEILNLTGAKIKGITSRSWKDIGHMEYDEMAYQLFLANFRDRNLPDEANQCYYDYRDARRATLSLPRQLADYALMLFYGYGVKPDRPVIWAFVFMAIFAEFFLWRQGMIPVQKGEPEAEANRFTLPEAMAFSAMTFLSGGKLVFDPPEYRIAPGKPWRDVQICKALFVWERLMGMMLLFMFAVAVTKTIILGS